MGACTTFTFLYYLLFNYLLFVIILCGQHLLFVYILLLLCFLSFVISSTVPFLWCSTVRYTNPISHLQNPSPIGEGFSISHPFMNIVSPSGETIFFANHYCMLILYRRYLYWKRMPHFILFSFTPPPLILVPQGLTKIFGPLGRAWM